MMPPIEGTDFDSWVPHPLLVPTGVKPLPTLLHMVGVQVKKSLLEKAIALCQHPEKLREGPAPPGLAHFSAVPLFPNSLWLLI